MVPLVSLSAKADITPCRGQWSTFTVESVMIARPSTVGTDEVLFIFGASVRHLKAVGSTLVLGGKNSFVLFFDLVDIRSNSYLLHQYTATLYKRLYQHFSFLFALYITQFIIM